MVFSSRRSLLRWLTEPKDTVPLHFSEAVLAEVVFEALLGCLLRKLL